MKKFLLAFLLLSGCPDIINTDKTIIASILSYVIPDEDDKCGCESDEPTLAVVYCKEVDGKTIECPQKEATHQCCALCGRKLWKLK